MAGSIGWFAVQSIWSATDGSFTVNLSFGERPVRLPVNAESAPRSVSTPSPRRTACSTQRGGGQVGEHAPGVPDAQPRRVERRDGVEDRFDRRRHDATLTGRPAGETGEERCVL